MVKEAYCSCEVSELLRKKGFDYPNLHGLESDINNIWIRVTHQMAMAWLRKKNIIIDIHLDYDSATWVFSIYERVNPEGAEPYVRLLFEDDEHFDIDDVEGVTDAALKYSLENLI